MSVNYSEMIKEIIEQIDPSVKNLMRDGNENLIEDLGLDSIGLMTLLVELEKKFNISFESEIMIIDNFETINKLASFVKRITEGVSL